MSNLLDTILVELIAKPTHLSHGHVVDRFAGMGKLPEKV